MKYMGSKARYAKCILPIVLKNRKSGQWYVEPFVGGANMIDKVDGLRLGADVDPYLISMYRALQRGWLPPSELSEAEYAAIKIGPDNYPAELVAFVGFACSYAAKWFGGWCRGVDAAGFPRDYIGEAYRNVRGQASRLRGIEFRHCGYSELPIPADSIIYCDPPYAGTTKYRTDFEHCAFWGWCDTKVGEGHDVFVSEYSAPSHWRCVWEKEVFNSLDKNTGGKRGTERLFTRSLLDGLV
jgi:DNA adenine methylase